MNNLEEILANTVAGLKYKPGLTDLEKELLPINLLQTAKLNGYKLFIDEILSGAHKGISPSLARKVYEKRIFELSRKELLELLSAFLHKYTLVQ